MILIYVSFAHAAPRNMAWSNRFAMMQYHNEFDGPLSVSCETGQGMHKVSSVHSNSAEDRAWSWYCKKIINTGSPRCSQTVDYVNNFDLPMNFMCPRDEYAAGVESYHDNRYEDRRWKFTCCSVPNHITASCRQTGYVNEFDKSMDFTAQSDEVITGVFSYHDNGRE